VDIVEFLQTIGLSLLALLAGAAFCFAGFRFFLVLLPLWAFFAGLLAGAHGMQTLFGDGFLSTVLSWVVGFVLGIGFAVISYLWYAVAVILLGGTIGFAIGQGIAAWIGFDDPGFLVTLAGLAVGVVFAIGTIVLKAPKYLVIVLTGLGGATAVVAGVLLLLGIIDHETLDAGVLGATLEYVVDNVLWLIAWAALALVGIGFQVQTTRPYDEVDRSGYRYA
jgi:hypothetical protein